MRSYLHTLHYLRTTGALHLVKSQKALNVHYYIKGQEAPYRLKLPAHLPMPLNLGLGMLTSDILALFEKIAAGRFGLAVMFLKADKIAKDLTCEQLFTKYKQPETLIKKLWEPLVLGTMNTPIDKASAQVFVNIVRTIFFRDHRFSRLLFPTQGLGDLLVDPAVKYLTDRNHTFVFGAHITDIFERHGKIYVERKDADTEVFDALIYSSTSYENHVLPEQLLPTMPKLGFSPIINAYLWLDKEILHHPISGFIGTTIQWVFPKPSNYAKQLISCTVSAGENLVDLSNEEIIEIFWKDLCATVHKASEAKILRSQVIKEKRATVLLTPALQHARPHMRTSIPNLFLAGDLVQNALPMTIEGAVRNGQHAAKAVRKYLFPEHEENYFLSASMKSSKR